MTGWSCETCGRPSRDMIDPTPRGEEEYGLKLCRRCFHLMQNGIEPSREITE